MPYDFFLLAGLTYHKAYKVNMHNKISKPIFDINLSSLINIFMNPVVSFVFVNVNIKMDFAFFVC